MYTLIQYLNRVVSVAGASLYLVGEAREKSETRATGGAITLVSVYAEFILTVLKEKIFKIEKRKKK